MLTVWTVCKDPGGTNGIVPVAKCLRKMGHKVELIPNGKAIELLPALNEEFSMFEQALKETPEPEALFTSMCSDGGIGRDLVPLMKRAGVLTVALQDFWGPRLRFEWADPKFRPDFICVNDKVGADLVMRAWPDYDGNQVAITGFPAMDKYSDFDVETAANQVRTTLGLDRWRPSVSFGGQLEGVGDVITEVIEVLNELKLDIYFLPRPHPRMKNNAPDEIPKWEKALAGFRGGVLIDSSACSTSSVTASSSLVISAYSTINVEAACLRKDVISVLYPEVGMYWLRLELPDLEDFPLVQLGCSAKAANRAELKRLIERALTSGLDLRETQERVFRLDGKNARRVADLVG